MPTARTHSEPKREAHIFLDMDGVIADLQAHGESQNKFKKDGKLDYDALDYDFWRSVPEFPGAFDFYSKLKNRGQMRFLTGPIPSAACYGGKADWVKNFARNRGKWAILDLMIVRSRDKELIAGPDRILIDDRMENIRAWEKAGGVGVHHDGNFARTLQKLDAAMQAHNLVPPKPKRYARRPAPKAF